MPTRDGPGAVPSPPPDFVALAGGCLRRFLAQNERPPVPGALLEVLGFRLWAVVAEEGFPPPLGETEPGEPGDMEPERADTLVGKVFRGLPLAERHAELGPPTRQLLKACLQPEFRRCRESYREVVDGECRRQDAGRARARVSGSHCVDCPYWVSLPPGQHARLLARAWVSGRVQELDSGRGFFLPEDFRALRLWLHRRKRAG